MGNTLCLEALFGETPNYHDYVDEEGNFDATEYQLSMLAWKMRNGATLQDCLCDRKKKREAKRNNQVSRKKKQYRSCYRMQSTLISEQGVGILCVPKASNWYSQYVYMPHHCEETRTTSK